MHMRFSPWLALAGAFFALSARAGEAEIRTAIMALNPNAQIDSIKKTPIANLFEANVGGQIIYFSADGKYLLQGALVESATRRNLTEESQSGVRLVELKKLSAADMIAFPARGGKAKHTIKVFTDIDCGYCRKLHTDMAQLNELGIEVQYLWFPRAGNPSDSWRKATAVWCAKDQRKAMTDAKNGLDPGDATCTNPIDKDYQLGQRIGVNGTPAIFTTDGSLLAGYMPPQALFDELERRAKQKKAN
jgi:thiol:disulfide interchange protein DsbC